MFVLYERVEVLLKDMTKKNDKKVILSSLIAKIKKQEVIGSGKKIPTALLTITTSSYILLIMGI